MREFDPSIPKYKGQILLRAAVTAINLFFPLHCRTFGLSSSVLFALLIKIYQILSPLLQTQRVNII